jgi:hypothetical protein
MGVGLLLVLKTITDSSDWMGPRTLRQIDRFRTPKWSNYQLYARSRPRDIPKRRETGLCRKLSAVGYAEHQLKRQDFTHDNEMIQILTAMRLLTVSSTSFLS